MAPSYLEVIAEENRKERIENERREAPSKAALEGAIKEFEGRLVSIHDV